MQVPKAKAAKSDNVDRGCQSGVVAGKPLQFVPLHYLERSIIMKSEELTVLDAPSMPGVHVPSLWRYIDAAFWLLLSPRRFLRFSISQNPSRNPDIF